MWYSWVTEDGTRRLKHGLVKQMQLCMRAIALWSQKRALKHHILSVYNLIIFLILTYGHESWVFLQEYYPKCKWQRCFFCEYLTMRHFATNCGAVKFVKHSISYHFSESQSRFVLPALPRPCVQKRISNQALLATHIWRGTEVLQGPDVVTTSTTLLGLV